MKGEMKKAGFRTLRNPSDCSVLSHSDNTVYAVWTLPSPKCLASPRNSHTPRMLYAIALNRIHALRRDEIR